MQVVKTITYQGSNLVFNLDWLPLLGDTDSLGRQARKLGASHYIVSGKPAAALGLAYGLGQKKYLSASHMFAQQNPHGTNACLINLDVDSWHLLASHEGVVLVHADRSYTDKDTALQHIENLSLTYPNLNLITVLNKEKFFTELLNQSSSGDFLLRVKPLLAYYLLLLTVLLVMLAWWLWPQARLNEVANTSAYSQEVWANAVEDFLAQHQVMGLTGTNMILANINKQPVHVAGWRLNTINCNLSTAIQALWLCESEYKRLNLLADNKGFLGRAPSAWQLEFISLDLARAKWSLNLSSSKLNLANLPTHKEVERNWASELQYITPAFNSLTLSRPEQLEIKAPLDQNGANLPVPDDLPVVAVRKLKIDGPLRSAVLLKKLSNSINWKKLVLSYSYGVNSGSKASSLTIQLEGDVYEKRT